MEPSVPVELGVAAECAELLGMDNVSSRGSGRGDQVRLQVGMEPLVPVELGVAAECAELLGMDPSVPVQLGVAAECGSTV